MPSVRAGADPRFDAIIDKAMQPDREARYQSPTEFRGDLERIHPGPPATPERTREAAPPPALRPKSPGLRHLIAGAIVAQLLIAGGIGILWRRGSKQDSTPRAGTGITHSPVRPPATVRDAARWLVRERAVFKIFSAGREM
jgi:hypothetical protein